MRRSYPVVFLAALLLAGCVAPVQRPPRAGTPAVRAVAPPPVHEGSVPLIGPPLSVEEGYFSFAILGDRTGGQPTEWPVFDRAVDELNLLRPAFAVMVGDMIPGYLEDPSDIAEQWQEFLEHAERLEVPLFLLPGNHDVSNPGMLRWWKTTLGRTYYAYEFEGCLFLVLNAFEEWSADGAQIGDDQVAFALNALAEHSDARHVFVFIHPPLWTENAADWQSIESALAGRDHTVFAGHEHRLASETRNGGTYIVVSATKGATVGAPNELPEMGRFPHFTYVTVDDDGAHVAVIEPGGIWPHDVAPRAFRDAVAGLVFFEAEMPSGLGQPGARTGFRLGVRNGLPEDVRVVAELAGTGPNGWQPVDGQIARAWDAPPGADGELRFAFGVHPDGVLPVPRLRFSAAYRGVTVLEFEQNVHLFPESALRWPPDWMVVGPYEAGPLPTSLPTDPRADLPDLYIPHVPESGYGAGAPAHEDGRELEWRPLSAQPEYGLGFVNVGSVYGIPFEDFAYALAGVFSPVEQTVYARFRVDDYGQVFLNGSMIEDGRLYRTRRDPTWVALPLQAGWNTVIVKCIAIGGGWSFRLLFADPESQLQFASCPPE